MAIVAPIFIRDLVEDAVEAQWTLRMLGTSLYKNRMTIHLKHGAVLLKDQLA
jgi:hypothetical protein